jgi:acyl dehydratase
LETSTVTGDFSTAAEARGPYFDELSHGQLFDSAPGVTLTAGSAAVHQSIVGDRLALATDHALGRALSGRRGLAHPALVWDVAIGQSTLATHFVRANLFYRGLVFRRFPSLGDTLYSRTEVVGLKQNSARPGRPRTGLAALRITTRDQDGHAVLDFHRCAMLPLGPGAPDTGHADDLSGIPAGTVDVTAGLEGLDLSRLARQPRSGPPPRGQRIDVVGGDVVASAPELARLTLNIAQVHHDAQAAGGRRLVYGGHTIGLAASQVTRALPGIVTFLGWEGCDHTGPVHEGDTLRSRVIVGGSVPYADGLHVVDLRCLVRAEPDRPGDGSGTTSAADADVLDWRFTVLM